MGWWWIWRPLSQGHPWQPSGSRWRRSPCDCQPAWRSTNQTKWRLIQRWRSPNQTSPDMIPLWCLERQRSHCMTWCHSQCPRLQPADSPTPQYQCPCWWRAWAGVEPRIAWRTRGNLPQIQSLRKWHLQICQPPLPGGPSASPTDLGWVADRTRYKQQVLHFFFQHFNLETLWEFFLPGYGKVNQGAWLMTSPLRSVRAM